MITYRGEYSAPQFEHGDKVTVSGMRGVVQHRSHNGYRWEYGILIEGFPGIHWYCSPTKTTTEHDTISPSTTNGVNDGA